MEKAKPKDQSWRQYKKQARYLSRALQTANTRIDRIKAIHFEQSGICKQCQEVYPCTTRKLCGDE
jgi:hypothetical protein